MHNDSPYRLRHHWDMIFMCRLNREGSMNAANFGESRGQQRSFGSMGHIHRQEVKCNRLSSSYKWCRQCDNQLISTTLLRKKYARNETKKLLRRKRDKKLWNSLIIYRIVPIFGFQIFIFTCKKNSILSSAWSSNDRYWGGVLGWIGFDRMRNKHTAIIVKLDVQYSFCTFEEIN